MDVKEESAARALSRLKGRTCQACGRRDAEVYYQAAEGLTKLKVCKPCDKFLRMRQRAPKKGE